VVFLIDRQLALGIHQRAENPAKLSLPGRPQRLVGIG
jgi:hypothetical protein